ncbi:MAG TPA: hypothetical protein VFQ61_13985 [Polyangiaceae bacterium]|nr:hypothetical protein [Polyangiaceae bacterium]
MLNTASVCVGRLVEIRVGAGYRSSADVDAVFAQIARAISTRPNQIWVAVADWRYCPIMSSDAAERALAGMTRNNPQVERSAALASAHSPTAVLQFTRLVRESNNERRRLFDDASALIAWIGEVLTRPELTRLEEFLREAPPRR